MLPDPDAAAATAGRPPHKPPPRDPGRLRPRPARSPPAGPAKPPGKRLRFYVKNSGLAGNRPWDKLTPREQRSSRESGRHHLPASRAELVSPRKGEGVSLAAAVVAHLDDSGPKGVRKQETPRCLRFRNACSTSLVSEAGSIRQKDPFPGSSWERGTLMK